MWKKWKQWQILFSWPPKSLWMVTASHEIKTRAPWKKSYDQPRQHIKKQRHQIANKGLASQSYGFSSIHVWMWELDHKEDWMPKNYACELWCWKRLLRIPWTAKRSNPSILKEIDTEYLLEGLMLSPNTLATWCKESWKWMVVAVEQNECT